MPPIRTQKDARVAATKYAPKALAADYIKHVPDINIKLEGGAAATLCPARELEVPSDPMDQRKALQQAPAQLAFWSYQTERALRVVRDLTRELAHREGESSLTYRVWYEEELKQKYTEDMIRSRVSIDVRVDQLRKDLNAAQDLYGVLRATRDAVEHRIYALRRLIGSETH